MTTEQFRTSLKAEPFRPFIVRTADGREYRVDHPEMALMSKGGRTVALAIDDDAFTIVDLLLVTALETTSLAR